VSQGEGKRFIGNNIKSFDGDEMVLIGPNIPHVWKSNSIYFNKDSQLSTTVTVIYFSPEIIGDALINNIEYREIKQLLTKAETGVEILGKTREKIKRIMQDLLEENEGFSGILSLLNILHIISTSKELSFITSANTSLMNTEVEASRLNQVYEYTLKNFNKRISLDEIAALVHMTNTSFSRYFKSRVNKSYSQFLTETRIDYASNLLKKETITIERVSYECGFPSVTNFNRQFKKLKGQKPSDYRNEFLRISQESEELL
jgi:AraC-like DNA-binding protein